MSAKTYDRILRKLEQRRAPPVMQEVSNIRLAAAVGFILGTEHEGGEKAAKAAAIRSLLNAHGWPA